MLDLVETPDDCDNPQSIYDALSTIVAQALSFDLTAIPASTRHLAPSTNLSPTSLHRRQESIGSLHSEDFIVGAPGLSDPDDFVIYSTSEAEHIAYAVKQAFDIELASEVVLAAANTARLARTIAEARRVLGRSLPGASAT